VRGKGIRRQRWLVVGLVALMAGGLAAVPAAAEGSGATTTSSEVYFFADPATSVGRSQLVRTDAGIAMTFNTSGLMAAEALTVWYVVFNEPAACTAACGEDDLFEPDGSLNEAQVAAADIVVGYATGDVANASGRVAFHDRLGVGEAVDEIIIGTGPLLKDARVAEVHLVARSHGPAVPGMVDDQIGSYAGGCETFLNPPEFADEVGECVDLQFAVHLP
jgi:hypothetical protein